MGLSCYMCGLESKVVKLGEMQVIDDRNGQPKAVTVCEHCRKISISHNHPENQNLEQPDPQQPGFIKPSTPYPPVRPQ